MPELILVGAIEQAPQMVISALHDEPRNSGQIEPQHEAHAACCGVGDPCSIAKHLDARSESYLPVSGMWSGTIACTVLQV